MMEDFKGTKGSWTATKQFSSVRNVDLFTIHSGHTPHDYELGGELIDPTIAGIWVVDENTLSECEANAKLIAAAPDLLEALNNICNSCDGNNPDHAIFYFTAQAAIKKALQPILKT